MVKLFGATLCILTLLCSCRFNNITVEPFISSIWREQRIDGGFMQFNNTRAEFLISDITKDTIRVSAQNSLAILYGLVLLEEGIVEHTEKKIPVDNLSLSIQDLLFSSSMMSLQKMAAKITYPVLQKWMDSLDYGNKITDPLQTKISVDEQLGFIKRMYFNQLPFSNRTIGLIKKCIPKVPLHKPKESLSLITAAANMYKFMPHWYIGWREDENTIYFFSTYMQPKDTTASHAILDSSFWEISNFLTR